MDTTDAFRHELGEGRENTDCFGAMNEWKEERHKMPDAAKRKQSRHARNWTWQRDLVSYHHRGKIGKVGSFGNRGGSRTPSGLGQKSARIP